MKKSAVYLFYLTFALLLLAFVVGFLPSSNVDGSKVAAQSESKRWIVIFHNQNSIPQSARYDVAHAGGSVASELPQIGALVAVSSDPGFPGRIAANSTVSDVAEDVQVQMIPSPSRLGLRLFDGVLATGSGPLQAPGGDAQTGSEPFYEFQWDKKRMRASDQGSYAFQRGRSDVVVAVLDTGADVLPVPHQDVAPNLDFARSRSFVGAVPQGGDPDPAAWDDKNGHGSWCLSAVGAPINDRGISGVAPEVKLVALKVLDDSGSGSYVWLAQALIYAGINKFDVASMSLGGYLPRNIQGYHALTKLMQRAVNFTRSNGVTPIAGLGNDSFDLSDGAFMHSYIQLPGEIDGVVGVSATGFFNLKSSYSNYGVGKTDVSAPGGDFAVQAVSEYNPLGGGSVLGAWAQEAYMPNGYVFVDGTSMATPNAAGVAALIISQHGDFNSGDSVRPHMAPQRVEAHLQRSANSQECPEPRLVNYFTASGFDWIPAGLPVRSPNQRCQGDVGYNNFHGKGVVNAFKAVTDAP